MIDRRLHVLRMVHHYGTIAAAATALHITPPAVSQQMRQLSRELGVQLLEPDGRGVRLTTAAHVLIRHANEIHQHWEQAQAALATHTDQPSGPLRLCGFPTAIAALVAPAAAHLHTHHPSVTVRVSEVENADSFNALLCHDADIAIVAVTVDTPPATDPRFDQQPLLDDPHDLLAPLDHPLARETTIDLAQAAHEPWIVAAPDASHHHQLITAACAAAGFSPQITHQAKEWIAVAALVAHRMGVSLIPRLIPLPPQLPVTRIPLTGDPPPRRRILTCIRRGSHDHPLIALGKDALHKAATAITM
jgi:DNA-binding transcriptional LysR family regulator